MSPVTLKEACEAVPCYSLPSGFTVMQPTSSALVFLLGLEFIVAGILVGAVCNQGHKARILWGGAFLLWGTSCWAAGFSHQAFTWHLRCAGQTERCISELEDPFNIVYLWLQNFALNSFFVARSYRANRQYVSHAWIYCFLNGGTHAFAMWHSPSFREFESTLMFSFPTWLLLFIINRICIHDWVSTLAWLLMGVSFACFKLVQNFQTVWYENYGIWFTDNDALHVGNMFFVPVAFLSASTVTDAPEGTKFTIRPPSPISRPKES